MNNTYIQLKIMAAIELLNISCMAMTGIINPPTTKYQIAAIAYLLLSTITPLQMTRQLNSNNKKVLHMH